MAPKIYHPLSDPRLADVWSSEVILFEMLTNSMPFGVPTAENAMIQACQEPVKLQTAHLNKLNV